MDRRADDAPRGDRGARKERIPAMADPQQLRLEAFLARLASSRIAFKLDRVRESYVMVEIAVPGERWEVEFAVGGEVEVEVFRSDGTIRGSEAA